MDCCVAARKQAFGLFDAAGDQVVDGRIAQFLFEQVG